MLNLTLYHLFHQQDLSNSPHNCYTDTEGPSFFAMIFMN